MSTTEDLFIQAYRQEPENVATIWINTTCKQGLYIVSKLANASAKNATESIQVVCSAKCI